MASITAAEKEKYLNNIKNALSSEPKVGLEAAIRDGINKAVDACIDSVSSTDKSTERAKADIKSSVLNSIADLITSSKSNKKNTQDWLTNTEELIAITATISYLCAYSSVHDVDLEVVRKLYLAFQSKISNSKSVDFSTFSEILDNYQIEPWVTKDSLIVFIQHLNSIKGTITAQNLGSDELDNQAEHDNNKPAEQQTDSSETAPPEQTATVQKTETPAEEKTQVPTIQADNLKEPVPSPSSEVNQDTVTNEDVPETTSPVNTDGNSNDVTPKTDIDNPVDTPQEPDSKVEPTNIVNEPKNNVNNVVTQTKVDDSLVPDSELVNSDNVFNTEPINSPAIEPVKHVIEPVDIPDTNPEPEPVPEPDPTVTPEANPIPSELKQNNDNTPQTVNTRRTPIHFKLPEGFRHSVSTAIWNTPVITDFGYPFLNFSSEAIQHLFKTKDLDDKKRTFKHIKKMLKEAKKRYGGIWKAIYGAPLELFKKFANDPGTRCVPNFLKVDADILDENADTVTVTPIMYFSVDPAYQPSVDVPREFLENFYDVLDYTKAFKTYAKFTDGLSMQEFYEEILDNGGRSPFYLLIPKQAKFSRTDVSPGSLFSALFGGTRCIMLKTIFKGKRGCFLIDKKSAKSLYSDIN